MSDDQHSHSPSPGAAPDCIVPATTGAVSSGPEAQRDPFAPFQIERTGDGAETARVEQRAHHCALRGAVLEQQPAAGFEMRRGVGDDAADRVETVRAADQCRARLEAQITFPEVRIVGAEVRRIAGDQRESAPGQRLQPIAGDAFDVAECEPLRIAPRDFERGDTGVDRDHPRAWPFLGQGQRDRAAAGAEIGHRSSLVRGDALQGEFDQQLGFRAGDQRRRRYFEIEAPEAAAAEQICDRLTGSTAFDQRFEARGRSAIDQAVGIGEQLRTRTLQHVAEQQLGFARGVFVAEPVSRRTQQRGNGRRRGIGHHARMVTTSPLLPDRPQPLGALIDHSFRIWTSTLPHCFGFALLPSLVSAIPGRLMPRGDSNDPVAQANLLLEWLQRPSVWLLYGLLAALTVACHGALVYRMGMQGRSEDPGLVASISRGLQRLPAAFCAWLLYALVVGLSMLPWLAGLAALSQAFSGFALVFWFVLGSLVLLLPSAWISLAAGFFLFAAVLERRGPIASLLRSVELVRGQWWRSGVVVSVPLLVYVAGVGFGAILAGGLAAMIAVGLNGREALASGEWMLGMELLLAPVNAALLPLFFAGALVMFNELLLLRETKPSDPPPA